MTGTAEESRREFCACIGCRWSRCRYGSPRAAVCCRRADFSDREAKLQAIVQEIAAVQQTGRPVLVGSRTIENSQLLADRLRAVQIPFRLLNGTQDLSEAEVIARAGERGAVTIATNMAGRGTDIRLQPGVADLGGLHLIGVERHESPRIDRQLSGPPRGRGYLVRADSMSRRTIRCWSIMREDCASRCGDQRRASWPAIGRRRWLETTPR